MGCGASAAQIPAAPPAGSGLAAIKHQKSLERKADLKSLQNKAGDAEERRPSVSSDASTNTSGDNASCDNVSDSSAPQIFEEVAAAAITASDDDLTEIHGIHETQCNKLSVAEYAARARTASESDLRAVLDDVPSDIRQKISRAMCSVGVSATPVVNTFAKSVDVPAAATSTMCPHTLAEFATIASKASRDDVKNVLQEIPQEMRKKLSESLAPFLVADADAASKNNVAMPAVTSLVKSMDVEVKDVCATHPLDLAELAKVAGNASSSDLKDFFSGVDHTKQKKFAASIAQVMLRDYAAAASTIQDSDLKATLDKLPEDLRQKISQALCSVQTSATPALRDYAAAASTIQDSDLKATLDKLPEDLRQKISQALCSVQASATLAEVKFAKEAIVKDTDASATPVVSTPAKNADLNATEDSTTRPLTRAEIVEIAANASEEELRDFLKDVPEMDRKRIFGSLLLEDYAAAANAIPENELKTLFNGLPGEMRQKISQALPKI